MRVACEAAFAGDVRSAKEMREAIEGKAPQRLEIATRPHAQLTIRVLYDRRGAAKESEAARVTLQGREAERILSKMPGLPA